MIDEFTGYNRILSQEEVRAVFDAGSAGKSGRNHAPVASDQAFTVTEDGAVAIPLSASDVEDLPSDLAFTITTLPDRGVLKHNGEEVALLAPSVPSTPPTRRLLPRRAAALGPGAQQPEGADQARQ